MINAGIIVSFVMIIAGRPFSYSPIRGSLIDVGDVMLFVVNMYTAMYVFELCYRTGISPIAWLHHICTAIMGQCVLLLSGDARHGDGSIELVLCFIWGLFDILSEAVPHLTFILYRLFPAKHEWLHRLFNAAMVAMLVSTLLETATVLWIYVALFNRWRLALKVMTPIMHVLFTVAQLWGARALRGLAKREKKKIEEEKNGVINGGE